MERNTYQKIDLIALRVRSGSKRATERPLVIPRLWSYSYAPHHKFDSTTHHYTDSTPDERERV